MSSVASVFNFRAPEQPPAVSLVLLSSVPEGWRFRTALTRRQGRVLKGLYLGAGVCVELEGRARSLHGDVLVEILG